MRFSALSLVVLSGTASAFTTPFQRPTPSLVELSASASKEAVKESASGSKDGSKDPLLIRAAKGEDVERTPVWMMRQAGRHIAEYRELCKEYPTFRMRSEIPDVAVEVSLQPWRNYQTDGCILFSDILTPLPGMGCDFQIDEKLGPVMAEPIKNWDDVKKVSRVIFIIILFVNQDRYVQFWVNAFLTFCWQLMIFYNCGKFKPNRFNNTLFCHVTDAST